MLLLAFFAILFCATGSIIDEENSLAKDVVNLRIFFECHCIHCRVFFKNQLVPIIRRISDRVDVSLYPYGNAKTIINGTSITFECQHGPAECYGNKLHACASDILKPNDASLALMYSICLMGQDPGSTDAVAKYCSTTLQVSVTPIIECANGDKGNQLLKLIGEETQKQHIDGVPYALINGVVWNRNKDFFDEVCNAFKNPPEGCKRA